MGDPFLPMARSAKTPNVVSQQLQGLPAGRRYSLKLMTADYGALGAGRTGNR
jgi:hypothetical protein